MRFIFFPERELKMINDIGTSRYELGMIMKTGWAEFLKNFKTILPVALLIYIPVNVILAFIPLDYLVEHFGAGRGLNIYMKIVQLLEFFIGVLATMAIAKIIEESVLGRSISWKDAFRFSLSRWSASIGTSILGGLIILGMTLLLIIPGIIWWFYYIFLIYAIALRGLSGKTALDYSKAIVKGQWWRVFWYSIVIGIINLVVSVIIGLPFGFMPENIITETISGTFSDVVSMLFSVMMIIFFLNCDYLKNRTVETGKETP